MKLQNTEGNSKGEQGSMRETGIRRETDRFKGQWEMKGGKGVEKREQGALLH